MALAEDEEFDEEEGGLWNWNVKWEELDENILNKKLQPFPAEDLTKEMMMTLEKYGGFGFMYILRYDETKGSDPNLQYWRVYVSFLREDVPQFIIKIMYLQRNSIIYMIQFQFFFSVSIIFNLIGRTFDTLYYKIPFF
ncbi:uncharacterized protein OCT59_008626 [Rhizophagus irregularis]|uniref:uncharacterized protein n=1 Tax=Rhizophagus irregularis TaxID=588596 RepID=UPI0033291177|nr:hypothetical protein OCT59_008626 [Rhizophagus irregularis]